MIQINGRIWEWIICFYGVAKQEGLCNVRYGKIIALKKVFDGVFDYNFLSQLEQCNESTVYCTVASPAARRREIKIRRQVRSMPLTSCSLLIVS